MTIRKGKSELNVFVYFCISVGLRCQSYAYKMGCTCLMCVCILSGLECENTLFSTGESCPCAGVIGGLTSQPAQPRGQALGSVGDPSQNSKVENGFMETPAHKSLITRVHTHTCYRHKPGLTHSRASRSRQCAQCAGSVYIWTSLDNAGRMTSPLWLCVFLLLPRT